MGFNANDNHPLTNDTYDWGDERKPDRVLSSLERCAFLLHKIIDGDHHALVNACPAVDEAVAILREAGRDEEWMACVDAIDPDFPPENNQP
jgi:hypothetical protein